MSFITDAQVYVLATSSFHHKLEINVFVFNICLLMHTFTSETNASMLHGGCEAVFGTTVFPYILHSGHLNRLQSYTTQSNYLINI